MQCFLNSVYVIEATIIIVFILLVRSDNRKSKAADGPFYIPGVLEKKPIETPHRKVSDITTDMLRQERHSCEWLKVRLIGQAAIDKCQNKLIPINIRLSIKQTKP